MTPSSNLTYAFVSSAILWPQRRPRAQPHLPDPRLYEHHPLDGQ